MRPTKKDKLTEGQWKKLVASGGVVDADGRIWYPSEGALKGAILSKDKLQRTSMENLPILTGTTCATGYVLYC